MQHKRSGFTLIELLIVIAIIAILAALLFPVFARARQMAKQAACASNLKQIGTAFAMYANDYGVYPSSSRSDKPDGKPTWDIQVLKYVKNKKVFICPTDDKARTAGYDARSYSMNDQMWLIPKSQKKPGEGIRPERCPDPSQYVLLSEWHLGAAEDPFRNGNYLGSTLYNMITEPVSAGYHGSQSVTHDDPLTPYYDPKKGEGNNYLYFDCHVQFAKWWVIRDPSKNHWWFNPKTGKPYTP